MLYSYIAYQCNFYNVRLLKKITDTTVNYYNDVATLLSCESQALWGLLLAKLDHA